MSRRKWGRTKICVENTGKHPNSFYLSCKGIAWPPAVSPLLLGPDRRWDSCSSEGCLNDPRLDSHLWTCYPVMIKRHISIFFFFKLHLSAGTQNLWKMFDQCTETFSPDMQCGNKIYSFNKYLFIECLLHSSCWGYSGKWETQTVLMELAVSLVREDTLKPSHNKYICIFK